MEVKENNPKPPLFNIETLSGENLKSFVSSKLLLPSVFPRPSQPLYSFEILHSKHLHRIVCVSFLQKGKQLSDIFLCFNEKTNTSPHTNSNKSEKIYHIPILNTSFFPIVQQQVFDLFEKYPVFVWNVQEFIEATSNTKYPAHFRIDGDGSVLMLFVFSNLIHTSLFAFAKRYLPDIVVPEEQTLDEFQKKLWEVFLLKRLRLLTLEFENEKNAFGNYIVHVGLQAELHFIKKRGIKVDIDRLKQVMTAYPNTKFFCESVIQYADHDKQRIHPIFSQRSTSGRLSTSQPPLHQLPKIKDIRSCFQADENKLFVECDFSHFEVRTLASLLAKICSDYSLVSLFETQDDIYTELATRLEHDLHKQGQKHHITRDMAKRFLISLIYQSSDETLAGQLNIPLDVVVSFRKWWNHFCPAYSTLVRMVKKEIMLFGQIENPMGRKKFFYLNKNEKSEPDDTDDAAEQRKAFNYLIQSTAADLACFVLMESSRILVSTYRCSHPFRIVHFAHDSFVVEIDSKSLDVFLKLFKDALQKAMVFSKEWMLCPVEVKIRSSPTLWFDDCPPIRWQIS